MWKTTLRSKELLFEEILELNDIGFGLTQYSGKEYSLVGGSRSGSSPSNLTRVRYDIIDHVTYDETNDFKRSKLGFIELFVSQDGIDGLINIKLVKKKSGLGSKIIKDIVDTAGGVLKIYDVQKSAIGFWTKIGAEFVRSKEYDAIIKTI